MSSKRRQDPHALLADEPSRVIMLMNVRTASHGFLGSETILLVKDAPGSMKEKQPR
jgi:hypothetical protein